MNKVFYIEIKQGDKTLMGFETAALSYNEAEELGRFVAWDNDLLFDKINVWGY